MDEDIWGGLIGIAIVIGIIYVIVVYVIPLVLTVIIAAGLVVGVFSALKSIVFAIMRTIRERRALGGFSSEKIKTGIFDYVKEAPNLYYEDISSKSYFFGPCFSDMLKVFKYTFVHMRESIPQFGDIADSFAGNVVVNVFSFAKLVFLFVLGSLCAVALLVSLSVVFAVFLAVFYLLSGISFLLETSFRKSKKIEFRCPTCKQSYATPVYLCPGCGLMHRELKPGAYGIHTRKCKCGTKLPISHNSRGVLYEQNPSDGTYTKTKFPLSSMETLCPTCGKSHNFGMSRPISIALIGGASAGKTTFKIAFLNDFLNDETIRVGINYDFPDESAERELEEYEECYSGKRIVAATNRGTDSDISTFGFKMSGNKLDADRFVQIYDMPGETFVTGLAKEGWNNFTFSEGIVFLIDPYSITEVRENCTEEISAMGICDMDMNELITSLIDTLRQVKAQRHKNKFTIPVSLVINKVDTPRLRQMVGEDAVKSLMKNSGRFSNQYDAMDYICRCFLAEHGREGFISNLDNNFENVHFFYASPMGAIPTYARTRFHPVNVIPIMEWMLFRADSGLKNAFGGSPVPDLGENEKMAYQDRADYDKYVKVNVYATK